MNITDDQRRMLTEYIGECWHEVKTPDSKLSKATWPACELCGTPGWDCYRRSFSTGNDMVAVMEAIVKKGEWYGLDSFMDWVDTKWSKLEGPEAYNHQNFEEWIFRPTDEAGKPHFCRLVVEWKGWK